MTVAIDITAESRNSIGKRAVRRMRRFENKVPAIVYGANKDPMTIVMDHNKVSKAMESTAFFSSILTLIINGEPEKVIVKAIQRHPYRSKILHMDFFRINPKEKLSMPIPLHFVGAETAPGVKQGGVISHFVTEVEVRCLPADLPEFIEVDLSGLEMNQAVHLSELKVPEGVELVALLHEGLDQAIANVHMPHMIQEPTEAAPTPAAGEVPATEVKAVEPEASKKEKE